MRSSNRYVTLTESVKKQVEVSTEEFYVINENKGSRIVDVTIALKSADGTVLTHEYYQVRGQHYDLLMSESPDFAPGKPPNEYREADLWHIIDLIRETTNGDGTVD
ncbi:hypothetical protein MKX70_24010 [Paenibacillus sp. FSL R7-0312]|uniref:hypothetical protein n=1 Tax=Paenibacillus sp. FSL R7-0312 TaxID=2921682 RepID=UPI0030FB60DD